MAELMAYVNSPEGVAAAVQNGADAVCAAISAVSGTGLSAEDFYGAAEFCRVRGVKIYAELSMCPADSETDEAVAAARQAWLNGADAIVLSDTGLILAVRHAIPDAPIHAGSKMNLHNLDGVKLAAAMGAVRAAVSPEVSGEDLKSICENSPIEIEVLAHGFNCPAFQGQCSLAAFSGEEGCIRGRCSRACLLEYDSGTRESHPFAMKDICLISHIDELTGMKVCALRLDGTDRRPEYIAMLTALYCRALKAGRKPIDDELNLLNSIYPSAGFTDGYFTGAAGDMSGAPGTPPPDDSPFLAAIRKGYLRREFQRVPVTFRASVSLGGPLRLSVEDDLGNTCEGEGGKAELAFHRELTQTALQTELFRTGGTPFYCRNVKCRISKGLSLRQQDIIELRDRLLNELIEKRKPLEARSAGEFAPGTPKENSAEPPILTVSVLKASQLSSRILELAPPVIYIPLEEIQGSESALEPFLSAPGISVCAVLPRVIFDSEKSKIAGALLNARQLGIREVLVSHPGHVIFARQMGFSVRGGLGMNVLSSGTMSALRALSLSSVTLSPELSAAEVAAVSKYIPSELVVYGRLPLMTSQGCIVKGVTGICSCTSFSGISDRSGMLMPVTRSYNCGNTVYSSKKLFLARRSREYMSAGLWGVRLMFTTENARECAAIVERYLGLGGYEPASYMYGKF